jgi:predicted nucleic acid-binding protein
MPLKPTDALLDVNVLVASIFAEHFMHTPAREFVETVPRFRTSPMTQGGFVVR